MPVSMIRSRISLVPQSVSCVRTVRPPTSSNVVVTTGAWGTPPLGSGTPGAPSKISVFTSFSFGTTSRYSPWNATSNPSFAVITYRQAPPTRRSTSTLVTSPRSPLHHCEIRSGSVYAR